jgi:hypothetical protein
MTDPQLGVLMLGLFVVFILFGFPIAFTLMAMGVGFAFAAYDGNFDAVRNLLVAGGAGGRHAHDLRSLRHGHGHRWGRRHPHGTSRVSGHAAARL